MRTLLGIANIFLLLGMVVCCAGAMAGLIVFLPFVAGAWALNLVALVGYEEAARTAQTENAQVQKPNLVRYPDTRSALEGANQVREPQA